MQGTARVSGSGWIELRPCWARGMDRCAWEWAKAEFEGVWGSNSTGQGGVCTRIWWLLQRAQSVRSLNRGLMLPILVQGYLDVLNLVNHKHQPYRCRLLH